MPLPSDIVMPSVADLAQFMAWALVEKDRRPHEELDTCDLLTEWKRRSGVHWDTYGTIAKIVTIHDEQ